MNSIKKNKTWDLVTPPLGNLVIGCRWLFKVKENTDRCIEKCKSQLVVKGFT